MHVQAEILDESDIYEDVNRRLLRRDRERADIASYLAMFDHKLHATALSNAEMAAVASFLVLNVEEFAPLLAPHDMPLKVRCIMSVGRAVPLALPEPDYTYLESTRGEKTGSAVMVRLPSAMQGLISSAEIREHDVPLPDHNQAEQGISASPSGMAAPSHS